MFPYDIVFPCSPMLLLCFSYAFPKRPYAFPMLFLSAPMLLLSKTYAFPKPCPLPALKLEAADLPEKEILSGHVDNGFLTVGRAKPISNRNRPQNRNAACCDCRGKEESERRCAA